MLLTQRLYEEVADIWSGYLQHPFVKELGEGTLNVDKFKYYMIQDYVYLLEYVKVFAMGVIKADSEADMRHYSQLVYATLNGEMNIHKSYMKRLGITDSEVKVAKLSQVNASYTSYMQKVAYEGSLLELSIAVLSCAWSYEVIGKALAKWPGAIDHELYGEWIEGYSSEEYAKENQALFEMINRLGEHITDTEYQKLKDIFIRCSNYENDFWDMSYQG